MSTKPLPTITRLDDAIRECLGGPVYDAIKYIGRTGLHQRAMVEAFISDRRDEHADVLRVMAVELGRKGVYPQECWTGAKGEDE